MKVVFLSYMNRSGSTYLAQLLSSYPNICVCPEAEILIHQFLFRNGESIEQTEETREILIWALLNNHKFREWDLRKETLRKILINSVTRFEIFIRLLAAYKDAIKPEATVILFKGTALLNVFGELHEQYPEHDIKMIHILRDARAVYASQVKSRGTGYRLPMQRSPAAAAQHWKHYLEKARGLKETYPDSFSELKYEDLLEDIPGHMAKLFDFLKVEEISSLQAPAFGDLASRIPETQKHLHQKISEPPDTTRIKAWRQELKAAEIFIIEKVAGPELQKQGYPLINPKIGKVRYNLLFYKYNFLEYFRKKRMFWISLPHRIRNKLRLESFKKQLKAKPLI